VVFRRDNNKVDAFQRQMSSLRQQIGTNQGGEQAEGGIPDLEDERFPREAYSAQQPPLRDPQDTGGYSFGSYPGQPEAPTPAEQAAPTQAPELPGSPASDDVTSVVAKGTLWKGELEAEGSVHIYGRVEGALRAKEDIWIAEGADIDANVQARRVIVGGTITGTIKAIDRFEALPQCQVNADVNAPVFVVHEGANITGQLRMGGGDGTDSRSERSGTASIIQRRARTGA
jgi:cytoskeletal protein CcmA (bactofilin family)